MKALILVALIFVQMDSIAQAQNSCQVVFSQALKSQFLNRDFVATYTPRTDAKNNSGLDFKTYRVMSFEEIPDSYRVTLEPSIAKGYGRGLLEHFGVKLEHDYKELLDPENARLRREAGEIEVTNIFLSTESVDKLQKEPSLKLGLQFSPSLLGFLPSGTPVRIILLSRARDYVEIPTVRPDESDNLMSNLVLTSALGRGNRFYGIKKLSETTYGAVVGLPEKGNLMQFGGRQFVSEATLLQAYQWIQDLGGAGFNMGRHFDWRPYVATDGKVQMFPSTLETELAPSFLSERFFATPGLIAKSMGLELDARSLAVERVNFEKAYAMSQFLVAAVAADPSKNNLRGFFTKMLATDRDFYSQLMALAIHHLQVDFQMSRDPDRRKFFESTDGWPQELQKHASHHGVNFASAAGVVVPITSSLMGAAKKLKHLAPKDMVAMKLVDFKVREWKGLDEISVGTHVVAELIKIQLRKDWKRDYHFRILWHSELGLVDRVIILTADQVETLGAVAIERTEIQKYIRPLEQKRIKPNADLSYFIEDKQVHADIIQAALDLSRNRQLSASYINLNVGGVRQPELPEFPTARSALTKAFPDTVKYASHLVYHTPHFDRLILISPQGELEVRDAINLEKVFYRFEATPPVGFYKNEVRKVIHVGQKYFITSEPKEGSRETYVVRRVEDGVEMGDAAPDGFVGVLLEPNDSAGHILGLGSIHTVLLPSGISRYGNHKAQTAEEIARLEEIGKAFREMNTELFQQNKSGFLRAVHISADGQYLYIANDNFEAGSQVAVVQRSNGQILEVINSRIEDLDRIHSSLDNRYLIFEGWTRNRRAPVAQRTVFKRNR